jgi:hypothetical protein
MVGPPGRSASAPRSIPRFPAGRELAMLVAWAFGIAAVARWALSPYGPTVAYRGAGIVAAALVAMTLVAYRIKVVRVRRALSAGRGTERAPSRRAPRRHPASSAASASPRPRRPVGACSD